MVVIKHRHTCKAEVLSMDGDKVVSRSPLLILDKNGVSGTVVKTAATHFAYHGQIARDAEGNVDLIAEIKRHPDALWIRVKAIEADEPNDNGDFFSWEEIVKSYRTFEGCPVFTNHENNKVEAAKGKVVKAELDEKEKAVYCTMFIDRQANGSLCRAIEEGYITDVSMGTQVDYSTCSICNNRAQTADFYCDHVKTMKGRNVNGQKVFERNYGLKFIEISVVTDGACKDCTIREVLDTDQYIQKVADAIHCMREFKTGATTKNAGPQEVQKLNQAMDLLEDVARAMLDQRQYIDMEFLNKLSSVLSDLQHVNDELVDQGYGRMPGPGMEGGAAPGGQMGIPPLPENKPPATQETPLETPKPFVTGPAPGVGSVTGPAMAAINNDNNLTFSARIEEVVKKLSNIYQEVKLSRGATMDKEKAVQTISKLAKIWENPSVRNYRTEVSEGDFTVVIGDPDIFGLKGGKRIASLKIANLDEDVREKLKNEPKDCAEHLLIALQDKYAKASEKEPGTHMEKEAAYKPSDTKEQQEQTMEAQLRTQKLPLHPRTNDDPQSITEDQLKSKTEGYAQHERQDKPRESITEAQLEGGEYKGYDYQKRQNDSRDQITELQLRNEKIKGNVTPADKDGYAAGVTDQKQQITEGQLNDWKKVDSRHLPEKITEKQLEEDSENWGRRIASKEDAMKAKTAALKAVAKTSLATGATPDEILAVISDFTSSAKNHLAAEKAVDSLAPLKDRRQAMLNRSAFHGAAKTASQAEVADYLLGASADEGMQGNVALATLATLADQKNATGQITEAITASKSDDKAVKVASSKDFLKEAFAENIEELQVLLDKKAIKEDEKDTEKFAAAAFEAAIKVAEKAGLKVKDKVHVQAKPDGKIEVAMTAIRVDAPKVEAKEEETPNIQARKEARKVMAQMGGALPGDPAGAGAPGAMPGPGGGTTMPPPPPGAAGGETPPVAALGAPGAPGAPGGEEAPADEAKEALPPGSICPVCGSENVDIKHGDFTCNDCGGAGEIQVSINIKEWPGVIEDTEPKAKAEGMEGGIGDMGGGPGMEMPPIGLAAAFKVTPEMVKIAGGKPIGSFCPHCGSSKTKVSMKQGAGTGRCNTCKNAYRIDTLIEPIEGSIMARIAWYDQRAKKYASEYLKTVKQASAVKVERKATKVSLVRTLRDEGLTAKFANADLKGKAAIIAGLVDKGLLKK